MVAQIFTFRLSKRGILD